MVQKNELASILRIIFFGLLKLGIKIKPGYIMQTFEFESDAYKNLI